MKPDDLTSTTHIPEQHLNGMILAAGIRVSMCSSEINELLCMRACRCMLCGGASQGRAGGKREGKNAPSPLPKHGAHDASGLESAPCGQRAGLPSALCCTVPH